MMSADMHDGTISLIFILSGPAQEAGLQEQFLSLGIADAEVKVRRQIVDNSDWLIRDNFVNLWVCAKAEGPELELDVLVEQILVKLRDGDATRLHELCRRYESQLSCYIRLNDAKVGMRITAQQVAELAALNSSIDLDVRDSSDSL